MNTIKCKTQWELIRRWIGLLAGGPVSFIRGLSAIVAMLRAA
jgi:hypothetical protein